MSDPEQTPEEMLRALEPLHDETAGQVELNRRVYDAVEKALGRIAREHYPRMDRWNGTQLRKLADVISRHASDFAGKLEGLDWAGNRPE